MHRVPNTESNNREKEDNRKKMSSIILQGRRFTQQ